MQYAKIRNRFLRSIIIFAALAATSVSAAQGPRRSAADENAPIAPTTASAPTSEEGTGLPTAARIAFEIGAGAIGMTAAWLPTLLGLEECERSDASDVCGLGVAYISLPTTAVLAPALTSVGVYLAGEASGGDANYWYTLLGSTVGTAASVGGAVVAIETNDSGDIFIPALVTALSIAPVVGAMIGYELSNNADDADNSVEAKAKRAKAAARATFIPEVAATPDLKGATVGLSGRF